MVLPAPLRTYVHARSRAVGDGHGSTASNASASRSRCLVLGEGEEKAPLSREYYHLWDATAKTAAAASAAAAVATAVRAHWVSDASSRAVPAHEATARGAKKSP